MDISNIGTYSGLPAVDGSNKFFQTTVDIPSKSHVGVYFDDVLQDSSTYDILGSSIIFKVAPSVGVVVSIQYSESGQGFPLTPTGINLVATNMTAILDVANIKDEIVNLQYVKDEINTIGSDSELIEDIKTAEENALSALDSKNIAENYMNTTNGYKNDAFTFANNALQSEQNASASESNALASANNSQLRVWESQAIKMTADSYATEPEDIFVKIYSSNGDGTFSYVNSTEYSALHYMIKTQDLSTGSGIVFESSEQSLTNKDIDSATNWVSSNRQVLKVKATENLYKNEVVMQTGYNSGEDAYEVAKWTIASGKPALGILERDIINGNFDNIVRSGLVKNIDTSMYATNTIYYADDNGSLTSVKPSNGYYQACVYILASHGSQGAYLCNFVEPLATINELDAQLGAIYEGL